MLNVLVFTYTLVYIITNQHQTTLYIGVTNNLRRRLGEHSDFSKKNKFSSKYKLNKLVWYEIHENSNSAINREKQLKGWNRKWKE
ncbi:GIY-YIG nuclease family protein [Candidatus Dojkabacteria bacterium]|uniref:GIY-YIG nuclease family protein n=1 Tax=Candidatus Dojkabacteria bacterium TaxID=2099670 RepID=A0A955RHQ4_9BACT|nr:GIY-YIG nuclease family protein [Candidatus Dojkabacteria bacterium]